MTRSIPAALAPRQVPDLLTTLFAAEVLAPSGQLWLASPWLTDLPVLDNGAGMLAAIAPAWGRERVRLSQVLATLAERGTEVRVLTTPDLRNKGFLDALAAAAPGVRTLTVEDLPVLGLVGDGFALLGALNFAHRGVTVGGKDIEYTIDPAAVAAYLGAFDAAWAGPR